MLAIALALGSSVCYGVSNFIGPQLVRRHTLVSVLVFSQLAALSACALYLLIAGGNTLPLSDLWLALLAGIGNAGGLIGFYKAAELGPLSVAAPIGASGAIIPVIWGLTSGDSLATLQILGLILAMGGAALAARRPTADADGPELYLDTRASAIWAAASAVAFGVFLTALPRAAIHGQAWTLLDARLGLLVVLLIWARGELGSIRSVEGGALLAIPGLLLVSGTMLYTTAAAHGQLSVVSVLGSLFPIFTVGLGVTVLHERLSPAQTLGVTSALAGIALIAT